MLNAHEAWASPVEVAVAIYLLQRQIGYITVVPVFVSISTLGASYVFSQMTNKELS